MRPDESESDDAQWRRPASPAAELASPAQSGSPDPVEKADPRSTQRKPRPQPPRRSMPARRFTAGQPDIPGSAEAIAGAATPLSRAQPSAELPSPASRPPELVEPAETGYEPPPRMIAPPADWRPPYIVEPAPPRWLPSQDHEGLDLEESRARTLTQGIGIVAAAIMVVMMCAICGRVMF